MTMSMDQNAQVHVECQRLRFGSKKSAREMSLKFKVSS